MIIVILTIALIGLRIFECVRFIKKVKKVCIQYDMKYINDGNDLLVIDFMKKDYYMTCEWSAKNFLFLKGPNPLFFFFSVKPMTLEAQYDKEAIEKLNKYEII